MKSFLKYVVWAAIIVVIGYGGYKLYDGWWSSGGAENFVKSTETKARQAVSEASKKYADKVVSETREATTNYFKKQAAKTLSYLGEKIAGAANSLIVGETSIPAQNAQNFFTVSDLGKTLGFIVPPPPTTIIAKIGTPLVFSVNRSGDFSIDWGDSTEENGRVEGDKAKVLSHSWASPGDYTVKVVIQNSGPPETESFPVRVYE